MGYEHNINYKNKIFSIITTDLGDSMAIVKTSIFIEGRILVSIEKSYKALIGNPLKDILLKKIIRNQHGDVLKKLINSSYDGLINEIIINEDNNLSIEEKLRIYRENKLKEQKKLKEDEKGEENLEIDTKKEAKDENNPKEKILKSEKTLDSLILNYFKD